MLQDDQKSVTPENICAMELEKCLDVGLEVFLDPNPGHQTSTRFSARVRGWESGRYLLLGVQHGAGMPAVRPGKNCVIRFMHEGEVWGFSASVCEASLTGGYPIIQLHWPAEVARVQVRKHERVLIETPCTVLQQDDTTLQGTISDLSGGGCSLLLDTQLDVGATVRLTFDMPDGGQVSRRPVVIRNRKAAPGKGTKYGCQFQSADDKDHNIQLFVARKIAVDRGQTAPHRQVLVLSPDEMDVERVQTALAESPYEVLGAAGILDLGYRLRTCAAAAILLSSDQRELPAFDLLSLIRQSPGLEAIPLVLYGESSLHARAMSSGATLCLSHLSEAQTVLSHLPNRQEPPPEAPRTAATATNDGHPATGPQPGATEAAAAIVLESETEDGEIQLED